jgi:hypothetical protein
MPAERRSVPPRQPSRRRHPRARRLVRERPPMPGRRRVASCSMTARRSRSTTMEGGWGSGGAVGLARLAAAAGHAANASNRRALPTPVEQAALLTAEFTAVVLAAPSLLALATEPFAPAAGLLLRLGHTYLRECDSANQPYSRETTSTTGASTSERRDAEATDAQPDAAELERRGRTQLSAPDPRLQRLPLRPRGGVVRAVNHVHPQPPGQMGAGAAVAQRGPSSLVGQEGIAPSDPPPGPKALIPRIRTLSADADSNRRHPAPTAAARLAPLA